MRKLLERIQAAVAEDQFVVSWHADERCEQREISTWQVVESVQHAQLLRERPRSLPYPSIVLLQTLADGTEIEAVWAWLPASHQAKLVTVYLVSD